MSAENDPTLLADLNYFDPEVVRDAETLFGHIDIPAIQKVLGDTIVQEQIALLRIARQVSQANDPEQTRRYERVFGLLNDEAERNHGASRHRIALYLANQAIGRRTIADSSTEN